VPEAFVEELRAWLEEGPTDEWDAVPLPLEPEWKKFPPELIELLEKPPDPLDPPLLDPPRLALLLLDELEGMASFLAARETVQPPRGRMRVSGVVTSS
jgi:hypothetical protein